MGKIKDYLFVKKVDLMKSMGYIIEDAEEVYDIIAESAKICHRDSTANLYIQWTIILSLPPTVPIFQKRGNRFLENSVGLTAREDR